MTVYFRRNSVLSLLWCFALAPAAVETLKAQSPNASSQNDSALHVIVAVQGQVTVKREGWSNYAAAPFGTALRRGDLLRLAPSSQVSLVCGDLTFHTVSDSGIAGIPCAAATPLLTYNGSLVMATRGDPGEGFPVLLAPRRTKLLNPHPSLAWTRVAGNASYTVSVHGSDVNWNTKVSSGVTVPYPESAPVLKAGETYKVTVVAGNRNSNEEDAPDLGFTMMKPDEAQAVHDAEAGIRALGLGDGPMHFLVAQLYASRELNAEAIEQLEQLSTSLKEPAVERLLADLYLRIGVNRYAEKHYLQASQLSLAANDVEGQALAQTGLGYLYEALGNKRETEQRFQEAVKLYQKLGDTRMVKQIQERPGKL